MLCLATQYFEITYNKFEVTTPVFNSSRRRATAQSLCSPYFNSFQFPGVTFARQLLYLNDSVCSKLQPQLKDSSSFNNPVRT